MDGLSFFVVTHNEEATIARCLSSIRDIVDEIVIVDGESTDKTIEIAQSFGKKVKIIHEKNPDNFIVNKQIALHHVTHQWVLELDADEVVSKELQQEIKEAKKATNELSGYFIPRLNYFLGQPLWKGGQYPDYKMRLYKKDTGSFAVKSVHDTFQTTGQTARLNSPIHHYSYPTFSVYMRKTVQYAVFEGNTLFQKGVAPTLGVGMSYFIIKPLVWFGKTYIRHRGYKDGFAGFAFSGLSSIRYWFEFIALYEASRART